MTTFQWNDWNCSPVERQYSNGRTAIQLVDRYDMDPIATATVNLVTITDAEYNCFASQYLDCPEADVVLIKSYSENEGLLEALCESGIVTDSGIRIQSGYVFINVCRINRDRLPKQSVAA